MRCLQFFLVVGCAAALGACTNPPAAPTPDLAAGPDLGGFDLTAGGMECTDPRATPYQPNLTHKTSNGMFSVTMVRSEPGPPIIGSSAWLFQLTDANGNPVEGATLASKPWMPDHGHGTSVKATMMETGGGGYTLYPLYLFMAGLWETTITVTAKDGTTDTTVFSFCLAETL